MYIPEFACGFIAGAAVMLIGLVAVALWNNRKKK